jgi:hypothetical protein
VNDPTPCACSRIRLSEATLRELRERYDRCLCLGCLAELASPGADEKKPARS